jgi:hypothetical protein
MLKPGAVGAPGQGAAFISGLAYATATSPAPRPGRTSTGQGPNGRSHRAARARTRRISRATCRSLPLSEKRRASGKRRSIRAGASNDVRLHSKGDLRDPYVDPSKGRFRSGARYRAASSNT